MKRPLFLGALVAALTLSFVPATAANAATTITAELGGWVQAGESADFSLALAGTTGEDLLVTIELAEGTMSVDDTGLDLTLQMGSLSFTDVATITFTGSSADVTTALADRLSWTAPVTPERSYLRLSASVGSYYEGLITNATTGQRYLLSAGTTSWPNARDAAAALAYNGLTGYLATITTPEENSFLTAQTGGVTAYLAATSEIQFVNPLLPDEEEYANEGELRGVYHWGAGPEAGERVTYLPWFPDEPNGTATDRCLVTNWFRPAGEWNDVNCSSEFRYLVEFGGLGTDTGPALFDNLDAAPPVDPEPEPELAATGVEPLPASVAASFGLILGVGMLALSARRRAQSREITSSATSTA